MTELARLELREGKWASLVLSSDELEHPKADIKVSFTQEYLHIKAAVNDLHFKDGERSWRYGDGFLINFITKTYLDGKPSEKFYTYGFSKIAGEKQSVLVSHNGIGGISIQDIPLEIEIYEALDVAFYNIEIPWEKLKPFHPLLHETLGINIRYNSQNNDGSTERLQLVRDKYFEAEGHFEKRYLPIHLHQSDLSKLQFAFEIENNLVKTEKIPVKIKIYSDSDYETQLVTVLRDTDENTLSKAEKKINLQKGINCFPYILETPDRTRLYDVTLILDNSLTWKHEFYRLSSNEISKIENRLRDYEAKAKSPLAESSFHGLTFRFNDLLQTIKTFDPTEQAKPIKDKFDDLKTLIQRCEAKGHFYQEEGNLRTAFKSSDDNTLQPYSIVLPRNFDPDKAYKLLVALHGSGVDEIRYLYWTAQKFEYVDNDYLFVAPRGRGLSDHYMGQSEKDVLEIIDTIKNMFNITKTLIFGFSMGGFGVWRLTFLHPQSFDAGIIGSGCPFNPFNKNNKEMDVRPLRQNAKHIPYLVLHGTDDRAVPFKPVKEFIKQIQREDFNVTFKVFEGAGHANYDPRETIFKWLEEYG